ncbi:MAG: pyridoxamine 5'-phosphate oxidase family protein [Candidatus Tectomicrobia bacterium]|nr:pyridoxamine 5'-phosphate oxidase family protein [Candidatus Tectomicrobia bacterium]
MLADPVADILAARAQARQSRDPYVDVCVFVTVSVSGAPEMRAIALRDIDTRGFGLLINANSPKWQQVSANGQCSLHLFWATVQRQYRVYGHLEPMEAERLQQYWERKGHASRLLEHYYEVMQPQSQPLPSREALLEGIDALKQRYPDADRVPLAASLRGVYLYPTRIDAWHGSPLDRLHDRRLFTRTDVGWSCEILVP